MVQFKKILCHFDFSENAQEALQYAIHLMSKDEDATLYLTHVVVTGSMIMVAPFMDRNPLYRW